jgi:hypothetical protein
MASLTLEIAIANFLFFSDCIGKHISLKLFKISSDFVISLGNGYFPGLN